MVEAKVQVKQGTTERTSEGPVRTPAVDIFETDRGLTVVAELPGVGQDDVQVEVEKGVLTISGQARPADMKDYTLLYNGLASGGDLDLNLKFYRAFALSDEIDRDKASASMKEGVLTVVLPKAAAAQTRKIKVDGGPQG